MGLPGAFRSNLKHMKFYDCKLKKGEREQQNASVSILGTHRDESFFMCTSSRKMFAMSESKLTHLHSMIIYNGIVVLFYDSPPLWQPERSSLNIDEESRFDSAACFFPVENDYEASPEVETNYFVISVAVKPFYMKYLMIAGHLILSIS